MYPFLILRVFITFYTYIAFFLFFHLNDNTLDVKLSVNQCPLALNGRLYFPFHNNVFSTLSPFVFCIIASFFSKLVKWDGKGLDIGSLEPGTSGNVLHLISTKPRSEPDKVNHAFPSTMIHTFTYHSSSPLASSAFGSVANRSASGNVLRLGDWAQGITKDIGKPSQTFQVHPLIYSTLSSHCTSQKTLFFSSLPLDTTTDSFGTVGQLSLSSFLWQYTRIACHVQYSTVRTLTLLKPIA
jgi:hypothetical protein